MYFFLYKYILFTPIQHPLFEAAHSWEYSQVIHILPLLPCTHLKSALDKKSLKQETVNTKERPK